MNLQTVVQRLYDSRFRSTAFAVFGAVIIFGAQEGIEPLTQLAPWVRQFAALALLVYGLMVVATPRDDLGGWPPARTWGTVGPRITAAGTEPVHPA